MTQERGSEEAADGSTTGTESDGDRVVSILGVDVVIEEEFVEFPWLAGVKRAPVAFVVAFVLVALLVLVGGIGDAPLTDQIATIGIITFNAHNISTTVVTAPPEVSSALRPIQGLFVVALDHGQPLGHLTDIIGGKTDEIGHFNFLQRQDDPDVPVLLYYLVPVSVLVGVGYEFAEKYWEEATTDTIVEVGRFGIAVGVGYVAVLLFATLPFALRDTSPIWQGIVILPDRYMTLIYGFVYPAVFSSLGAAVVYLQREGSGGDSGSDSGGDSSDSGD